MKMMPSFLAWLSGSASFYARRGGTRFLSSVAAANTRCCPTRPFFMCSPSSTPSSSAAAAAAAASAAARRIDLHDVAVTTATGPAGTGRVHQRRLRVHVMPLESDELEVLLSELHARAAANGAVMGMDAEWQPELQRDEKNPVALLQLAWDDDIFLLRLQHLDGAVPVALHRLLGDESIVKVGCAVGSDVKRLQGDYGLETRSALDLRDVLGGLGLLHLRKRNLAFLAKEFLGFDMDKTMQCSDWSNRELSPAQITYSAVDAWAAFGIVDTLFRRYKDQVGQPQPPCVTSFCRRLFPRGGGGSGGKPKAKRKSRLPGAAAGAGAAPESTAAAAAAGGGGVGNVTTAALLQTRGGATVAVQQEKGRRVGGHLSRSAAGPMYDNGRMLAPDGKELLCTLSRKKACWYLERGLAALESGSLEAGDPDPPVIRLLFEPSGRRAPVGEEDAACERVNQCVACGVAGEAAGLVRHHVVPVALRRHFPQEFKEHMSHDVLALCLDCHLRCNASVQRRMEAYETRYAAPLLAQRGGVHMMAVLKDRALERVRKAGAALLKQGDALPAVRRAEFEAIVAAHTGVAASELTPAAVEAAAALDPRVPNAAYVPVGQRIVDGLLAGTEGSVEQRDGRLTEFIRGWRQHFVEQGLRGQRAFLPPYWSVDFRTKSRLRPSSRAERGGGEPSLMIAAELAN